MNRYEEYQETGFEWLGKIPSNWGLSRVGKFFTERSEKVDDVTYPPLSVTMSGIVDQLSDVAKTNDGGNRKLVKKHDFVINSRSDRKGSSGISPRDGSVSLINIVLEPRELDPQFIQYLFKNYYFKEEYFRNGKGIHWDLWTTRWDQLKNIKFPIPSNKEQELISRYLDKKTEQIDSLIEKIQKKIELLKEQRTSLINQCVTKGLDPNVEMKDSGVEWIGEIPSHWKVVRLKYLIEPREGRSKLGTEELLSVTIQDGVVRRRDYLGNEDEPLTRADDLTGYKLVEKGNLVNNIMKMGFCCLGISDFEGIVSPAYSVFEINTDVVLPTFLHKLLRTEQYVREYKKRSKGIQESRMRLYDDYFLDIYIQLPPLTEQCEIVKVSQTTGVDLLIVKETQRLELFREYRQSLISSVVTGKVRVTEDMV